MADDKKDSAKNEDAAPAPAPASGGFKAWLPLIITILLMPALAFGMTKFVLLPQLQKGLGVSGGNDAATDGKPKEKKSAADVKHESVPMQKLLVNVSGTMGARYLLVSLSVVGTGADFKNKMTENDAQLRDMATGALQLKTLADLEKPGSRNTIRSELLNGFNTILGDGMVTDIFFTEFAIQ